MYRPAMVPVRPMPNSTWRPVHQQGGMVRSVQPMMGQAMIVNSMQQQYRPVMQGQYIRQPNMGQTMHHMHPQSIQQGVHPNMQQNIPRQGMPPQSMPQQSIPQPSVPQQRMPQVMPQQQQAPPPPQKPVNTPPTLVQTKGDWSEYRTHDNKSYFHNKITRETKWHKPEELKSIGEKILDACPWKSQTTEDGRTYYYHAVT